MSDNTQKTPLAQSLNKFAAAKARDAVAALGKGLPCTVAEVNGPGIVTVNFAVATSPFTLPRVKMPVAKPPYIQYPIQVGDIGVALSADLRTGGLTGLGGGTPNLSDTVGNLSAMTFIWLGSTKEEFLNPAAVSLIEPTGNCNVQISPSGVVVDGANGNLFASGNLGCGNGATGSFTTATGQTVMVSQGIIIGIF